MDTDYDTIILATFTQPAGVLAPGRLWVLCLDEDGYAVAGVVTRPAGRPPRAEEIRAHLPNLSVPGDWVRMSTRAAGVKQFRRLIMRACPGEVSHDIYDDTNPGLVGAVVSDAPAPPRSKYDTSDDDFRRRLEARDG